MTKVMIPLVSTVLFYVCAEATMSDELHGLVAISVLVFIVAFFVAKMFTEVRERERAVPPKVQVFQQQKNTPLLNSLLPPSCSAACACVTRAKRTGREGPTCCTGRKKSW